MATATHTSSDTPSFPVFDDRAGAPVAPIRVLIADDHPLIIAAIRRLIEQSDGIEVVGEAHSGPELLALAERRQPGLVLMDLRMPGIVGVDCIEHIARTWPGIKVVVLSACDDRATIESALHAGANAYIVKSASPVDIVAVLRQASNGAVFHAGSFAPPRVGMSTHAAAPILTDREASVLSAVATGLTTAVISRELWISEHTVKFHLTNIYRKLGVANRAGAVRYAVEHDLTAE